MIMSGWFHERECLWSCPVCLVCVGVNGQVRPFGSTWMLFTVMSGLFYLTIGVYSHVCSVTQWAFMVISVLFCQTSGVYDHVCSVKHRTLIRALNGHVCLVPSKIGRLWSYLFCSVKHLAFMVISVLFCQTTCVYGHVCSVLSSIGRLWSYLGGRGGGGFCQASGVYGLFSSVKCHAFMVISVLSNIGYLWPYLFCQTSCVYGHVCSV